MNSTNLHKKYYLPTLVKSYINVNKFYLLIIKDQCGTFKLPLNSNQTELCGQMSNRKHTHKVIVTA